MTYFPTRARVSRSLNGLGGAESCGTNQVWDPDYVYLGIKGQCMPRSNYTSAQLAALEQKAAASTPSTASQIFGALLGGFLTPKPTAPVYAPAASGGISTGAAVAIGVGALALIVIATR